MDDWKRWRCPECESVKLRFEDMSMRCDDCGSWGPIVDEPVLGEGMNETMDRAFRAWQRRVTEKEGAQQA